MSFRNPCHMPFCNSFPPFTLTEITKGVHLVLKLSPKRPKITFRFTSLQQKFEEKGKSNFAHFANDGFFAATNSCKIGNRTKIATRITLKIQTPLNGPEGAWFSCSYWLMQLCTFEGGCNPRQPEGYFLGITYVWWISVQESLNKRTGSQSDLISLSHVFKWYENGS